MVSELCAAHALEQATLLDLDPPVFWSVGSGDDLCGFIEEHTLWTVCGAGHRAELWGRRRQEDGTYASPELLGATPTVSIDEIDAMHRQRIAFDLWEFEDTEAVLGASFLASVYERMAALNIFPTMDPPTDRELRP